MITQTYNLKVNGQGVFAVQLAEGLVQAGHEVMVIKPNRGFQVTQAVQNGVRVEGFASISFGPSYIGLNITPFPNKQIGALLDEFNPDIVHVQDHYTLCSTAMHEVKRRGLPVIGTNHFMPLNLTANIGLFNFLHGWAKRFLWWTVLRVMNKVDLITVPTRTAADMLQARKVIPPVQAVSCGIRFDRYQVNGDYDRNTIRQKYGIEPGSTAFIFVGRLEKEKRIGFLLKAFAAANRPEVQLLIAGHGLLDKKLKGQAHELGLDRQVVFSGFVPGEDLPSLLNAADYFAISSEAELQSIATLEAEAAGLPVLAVAARALVELVKHEVNGYLFRPGDVQDAARGIRWLTDYQDKYPEMSVASREVARRHRIENTVQQYIKIYQSVATASTSKK